MFEEFKKSTKKDWEEKAKADLKGEDVYSKYNWKLGDIDIKPMYDAIDLEGIGYLNHFNNQLAKENDPSGEVRVWKNIQHIEVVNSKKSNKEALNALNNGADGIKFTFNDPSINLNELLNDIQPEYCYLEFHGLDKDSISDLLSSIEPDSVFNFLINVSHDDLYELIKLSEKFTKGNLQLVLIESEQVENLDDQIASILHHLNREIRSLVLKGLSIQSIAKYILIKTDIQTDYFGEIAKLRALRNQVFQLIQAYGYTEYAPENVTIKCVSGVWINEKYQPHSNLLKASTASMSAIIGGCDILEVEPENMDSLSTRIARNTSNVLKEESYLAKIADPVAGSYYLESLTDSLAKSAWQKFINKLED